MNEQIDNKPRTSGAAQTARIYKYMLEYGSINPHEALFELGCMRLASRICDLKRKGVNVGRRIVKSVNRFGEPVKYAEYYIVDGAKDE